MSEYSDHVDAQALKAQTVSNDGVTVSRYSLSEQTEREKFVADRTATRDMPATVRGMFSKIVAPGGH